MDFKLITLKYVMENHPAFAGKVADKLAHISIEYANMCDAIDARDNKELKKLQVSRTKSADQTRAMINTFLKKYKNGAHASTIYNYVIKSANVDIARNTLYWYLDNNSKIKKTGKVYSLK